MSSSVAGYNKWGYTSSGWIIYTPPTAKLTTDQPYNSKYGRLLKAKLEVWDKDETELLITYDMFNPNSSVIVPDGLSVTRGLDNNSFSLTFFDGEKFLDASDIRYGTKIKIWASKDSSKWLPLFIGYTTNRVREGMGETARHYSISGVGEQAATNRFIANLQRSSTRLPTGNNIPRLPDSLMNVSNLFKELFTNTNVRVGGGDSIADILNLDVSGIDPKVDQYISSFSEFGKVDFIANKLAELGGANWRIEFGKLILEYPRYLKPTLTFKTKQEQGDRSDNTSYILIESNWTDEETISSGEGHATTIFSPANIDGKQVAGQAVNKGSMVLYNRIIFQGFFAIDQRFDTIYLQLSRIGDPTGGDQDVVLRGEIRAADSGQLIKAFEISPGSINDTVSNIFVNEIGANLISPQGNYYIILYPIGTDLYNTVRWHHNNSLVDFDSPGSGWASVSGSTDTNITFEDINNFNFHFSQSGPTYGFGVFSKINRLQKYEADTTVQLIGATEEIEEYSFLDDAVSTAKMMQNVLAYRSLVPRRFNFNVTIPDDILILPGMVASVEDLMLDASLADYITGAVNEVTYGWTAQGNEGLGLTSCNVRVVGFSDPLEDSLT